LAMRVKSKRHMTKISNLQEHLAGFKGDMVDIKVVYKGHSKRNEFQIGDPIDNLQGLNLRDMVTQETPGEPIKFVVKDKDVTKSGNPRRGVISKKTYNHFISSLRQKKQLERTGGGEDLLGLSQSNLQRKHVQHLQGSDKSEKYMIETAQELIKKF